MGTKSISKCLSTMFPKNSIFQSLSSLKRVYRESRSGGMSMLPEQTRQHKSDAKTGYRTTHATGPQLPLLMIVSPLRNP